MTTPNAIIVHGMTSRDEYYDDAMPSMSNNHWVPWLQKQLLIRGIATATPEMPLAYAPDYEVWRREFERYEIGPETILVGHSCGGGFLVPWLSEHQDKRVKQVLLVAPWLDPFREDTTDFFEFDIDPGLATRSPTWLFHSDDDSVGVQTSVTTIRVALKDIRDVGFHGYGHFTFNDLGTTAFPELLSTLRS
ncbi:alpha/beta hydrolase [Candidatus Saccharibacteria bacterium]|nr:alpha/beta hydrolase [Candidatus Saccharibacteria bacterium]